MPAVASAVGEWAGWIAAVLGPALVLWGLFGPPRRRWLERRRKEDRGWDIILGTPAEIDPLSGAELHPKVDDINTRMSGVERAVAEFVGSSIVEAQAEQAKQIATLRERQADVIARQADVIARVERLEHARVEGAA